VLSRSRFSALLSLCLVCCSLSSSRMWAQTLESDLDDAGLAALLKHVEANMTANDKIAEQYVADEIDHSVVMSMKGQKRGEQSAKYECVSVNGLPYRRMTEENGKPLSLKRQIAEQQRQDIITGLGKPRDLIFPIKGVDPRSGYYSSLPICCLDSLFDNRILRREMIDGRQNLVIESVPKSVEIPQAVQENGALDWKEIAWIDLDDQVPTRYEVELLRDKQFLIKGSTNLLEYVRWQGPPNSSGAPVTVWLQSSARSHMVTKSLWIRQVQDSEQSWTNFRRFAVDMHIVDTSVQSVNPRDEERER
jgi:hypothetical protein